MFIGWDIGIKNLSYCILDTVNSENKLDNNPNKQIDDSCIVNLGNKKLYMWNGDL